MWRVLVAAMVVGTGLGCTAQAAEIEIPRYPVPEDNAFDHYVAATELVPEDPLWEDLYNAEDSYDFADAEVAVLEAEDILATLREGIGKPCVLTGDMDFSTPFPYLSKFRSLTRLLMIEAWVRRERGDVGASFDSYRDALVLGQDAARGGALIHKLVSLACESVVLSHVRRSLPMVAASPETIEGMIGWLSDFGTRDVPLSEALALEYAFTLRGLEKPAGQRQGQPIEGTQVVVTPEVLRGVPEELAEQFAHMIEVASADYWKVEVDEAAEEQRIAAASPLVQLILPNVNRAYTKETTYRVDLEGTILVAALELYFVRHGAYPEKLEVLTPDIPAELPVDPCSGESFRYSSDGDLSYNLYSVGLNRVDDGGGDPLNPDPEAPDIVFSTFR